MQWRTWGVSCGLLATLGCAAGAARQADLWPAMRRFQAWDAEGGAAPRITRTTANQLVIEGAGWRRPGAIVVGRFFEQDAGLALVLSDTLVTDSAHRTGPRIAFRYRAEIDHLRPTWAYVFQVHGADSLATRADLMVPALP